MVNAQNGPGTGDHVREAWERRRQAVNRAAEEWRLPTALLRYLGGLRRQHPGVDPDRILELLRPLYSQATYSPEGELATEKLGKLDLVATYQAADEQCREDWKGWQARAKRIDAAKNRLTGLLARVGLGGPRRCPECRAATPAERTVWCIASCPAERASGLNGLERILAELDAVRGIKPGARLLPLVPARGEGSARAWVGPVALEINGYLVVALAGESPPPSQAAMDRMTARILSLASGDRITRDMVSDRTRRASNEK